MHKLKILFLFVLSGMICLYGQTLNKYSRKGIFLDLSLAAGQPMGELSERFGLHQSIGGGISYQPSKGLDIGLKYQFIFGNKVKEDVLFPYRTDFGQIIGVDNLLTTVNLRERGTIAYIYTGILFPVGNQTRYRHGIKCNLGLGFMEHRIRIQDDSRSAEQFYATDLGRGLDRLSNGFCSSVFLGYELKSFNGRINLYSGFEIIGGWTQNRRAWNYDTAVSEKGIQRQDFLVQFKVGWYLPFFFDKHAEYIEY